MTLRLIWSLLWRSLLLFTALGIVVSIGLSTLGTLITAPILLFTGITLVVGIYSGTVAGLAVGIASGLVVGGATRLFFVPLQDATHYRRMVRSITSGLSIGLPWLTNPLLDHVSFGRWSPLYLSLYTILFGLSATVRNARACPVASQ